jgi:hypothetical protein
MAVPEWVPKDLKKDFKCAEKQGWTFVRTKNGGRALAPDGVGMVTFHLTEGRNGRMLTVRRMKVYGYRPEDC